MEEGVLGNEWPAVHEGHSQTVSWPVASQPQIINEMPKIQEREERQPWPAMDVEKNRDSVNWPSANTQDQVSWPASGGVQQASGPIALPSPSPPPEEFGGSTPWASPSLQDLIDVISGIEERQPEADTFEPHGDVKVPATYNPFSE